MALTKIRLGDYIERSTLNNRKLEYDSSYIRGVNNDGKITFPKVDVSNVDLQPYKLVHDGAFVYNPSRLDIGSIALFEDDFCIVSHLYIIFYLNEEGKKIIDPKYLYMYFRRKEFQREVNFRNFGSQRPEFSYDKMCDIELLLPEITIQKKYVNVYLSMIKNQASYERGLDDLKYICDGYIEDLRRKTNSIKIGQYIKEIDERNKDNKIKLLQGFCMDGTFIEPRRVSIDIPSLKILKHGELIYNRAVECVTDKFIVAIREGETCAVSNSYIIFTSKDESILLNKYLLLWLKREEFARYSKFKSHGTAHENFEFYDLCEVEIPIPSIEVQKSIVSILDCYFERKKINDKMKNNITSICPILIKGAIEEAKEA